MFLTGKNSEAHLHISALLKRFSPLGQGQAELEKMECRSRWSLNLRLAKQEKKGEEEHAIDDDFRADDDLFDNLRQCMAFLESRKAEEDAMMR